MTSTAKLSPADLSSYLKCAQLYAILNTGMYADSTFKKAARVLRKKGDINFQIPSSPLMELNKVGSSLLHIVRKIDDCRILEDLLSLGADFTAKSKDGDTALLSVFKINASNPFINLILSAHIKFSNYCNPCDNNGLSHFHIACIANHVNTVEFFLENGVDINKTVGKGAKEYQGFTPLHFAVKFFNKETVEVLLKYGADKSIKNDCGMTPLHQLLIEKIELLGSTIKLTKDEELKKVSQERVQTIDSIIKLLNNFSNEVQIVDDAGLSSFHIACTMKDTSTVKNLLEQIKNLDHHVNMDSSMWPGYTALHFAAHCDNIKCMELLYKRGADVNAKNAEGLSPLDICLKMGFIEDVYSVASLKPQWANILFSDNKTKLINILSAMQDTARLKDYLHDCVDNINMTLPYNSPLWPGCTPLHLAVIVSKKYRKPTEYLSRLNFTGKKESTLEQIEVLLNRGADVTCKDASSRTPLHHAFRENKSAVSKLLRAHHHSSANSMDKENLSHLHIAYAESDENLVEKILSSNKVDANVSYRGQAIMQKIKPGWIPLDCANYRYEKINQILMIQHGARDFPSDVRIGINSLHSVCEKGDRDAVEWLLDLGADINSTLDDGQTPLHIAVKKDSVEVVEVLLQRGADLVAKDGEGHTPLSHVYEKHPLGIEVPTTKVYRHLIVATLTRNEEMQRRVKQQTGITLLHIACCMLDIDEVSTQLDRGAEVNARVHEDSKLWPKCTPLNVLIKRVYGAMYDEDDSSDEIAIMKLLFKNGADVNLADTENCTPVHLSCYRRCQRIEECSQVTELLFKHHRDLRINPVDNYGLSHFHIAIMLNDIKAVEQFLKHGVDVNQLPDYFDDDEQGCLCDNDDACWCACTTPLYMAIDAVKKKALSDTQMIDLLLGHGADVNLEDIRGRTALHAVLQTGPLRLHLTKKLLSFGADIHHESIDGRSLFEKLLRSDDFEEIDFFLQHGCRANVNNPISDEGYLGLVLKKENEAVRDFLFEKLMNAPDAVKVNELGRTIIHNVVTVNEPAISSQKYVRLFNRFKEIGHDVDAQDHEGRTALHLAAQFGNDEAISALLNMGADLNIIDSKGKSALSYAVEICERCDDEYFNDDHYHEKAILVLVRQLFRLHYFGIETSQINRDLITESLKILELTEIKLEKKFQRECNKAKNFTMEPLSLTLNNFLSETKAVINYSRMSESAREIIDSVFETIDNSDFDLILSVLKSQYRKAVTRFQLSEAVSIALKFLAGLSLPDLCADNILRFLSVGDLKNLVATTNLTI